MSLKKDIIETEFRTSGANTIQNDISKLEGNISRLNRENERLNINKKKLEAQGKKNTKEWKALDTMIKKNSTSVKTYNTNLKDLNSKLKITDKTSQQLTKDKRELARELNKTSKSLNPEKWHRLNNQYKETTNQLTKVRAGVSKTSKSLSLMKAVLPVAGFAALVAGIKKYATELWNLTKIVQGDAVRSSVVFGDQLGYVREESKKLAKQMGLTNREFVAAAAGTADLLIPLDFNRKQAANMSVELQSLAGALDEWTGGQIGAKGVSEILTKAMLGENEQLKQLGIAIRKDTDEFRDLVKVKIAETGATKVQAEAMATLELIQKKSADAQAAYTREGNKLLRFQKEASVRVKNLKENFISLFEVPVAKQLEEERKQVSLLSVKLLDSNTSYEDRVKVLGQLKTINPDIVKGIDAEKVSYEQLNKNLLQYNEQLAKRIVLANLQEDEEKAAAKLAKQLENVTNAQTNIQTLILDQGRGDILQSYDTWEEKLQAIQDHLNGIVEAEVASGKAGSKRMIAAGAGSVAVDTRTDAQKNIENLSGYTMAYTNAMKNYDEKLEDQLDFSKRINAMKELLGITDEVITVIDDTSLPDKEKMILWNDLISNSEKQAKKLDQTFQGVQDNFDASIDAELEGIALEMEADAELYDQKIQNMVDEQALRKRNFEAEQAMMEQRAAMVTALASTIGTSLGEAILDGEKGFSEFFKSSLSATVDFLGKLANAKIAQITMEALATPDSVATFGASGFARIALLSVAVNGAVALAKSAINGGSSEYYTGGHTGPGTKHQPTGIVHANEYVIPQEGYFNPGLRPFIDMIENARQAGTLRTLNPAGFADGGPTTRKEAREERREQRFEDSIGILPMLIKINRLLEILYEDGVICYVGNKQVRDIRDRSNEITSIEKSISR